MSRRFSGTSLPSAPLGLLDQAPGHGDGWGSLGKQAEHVLRQTPGGWLVGSGAPLEESPLVLPGCCLWTCTRAARACSLTRGPGRGGPWVLPSSVEGLQGRHGRGCSESWGFPPFSGGGGEQRLGAGVASCPSSLYSYPSSVLPNRLCPSGPLPVCHVYVFPFLVSLWLPPLLSASAPLPCPPLPNPQ